MSDEKTVREAWDAFVVAAKAAKHLAVCPGTSITAPVRISQIGPAPEAKPAPVKLSPKKEDPKPVSKPSAFGGETKKDASE